MTRKSYRELASGAAKRITEIMPWDVPDFLARHQDALLLDVREREEYARVHIPGSLNVPRGILEAAAEWDYPETVPELVTARDRPVLVICRSGNRSALAGEVLEQIGFADVRSVKLGIRGWNDSELELVGEDGERLDPEAAAEIIDAPLRPDQIDPARR